MGSYDDTIAVGRVLYAGNFPIVPPDEFWIPARSNPVKLSIVPIGGIHIFISETVDSDGNALVIHDPDKLWVVREGILRDRNSSRYYWRAVHWAVNEQKVRNGDLSPSFIIEDDGEG